MKIFTCLFILFFLTFPLIAQHNNIEDEAQKQEHEAFKRHHRVSIMMAFSHIPSVVPGEAEKQNLAVPTWGFNYDFWFHQKWGIGLHNDLIMQQFKVEEHHDKQEITRSYPVAVKAVGLFQPVHDLIFIVGYGKEFEPNEVLDVITAGVEYGVEIRNHWEVNFNLIFDYNIDTYTSWLFGIGFSRNFYGKH